MKTDESLSKPDFQLPTNDTGASNRDMIILHLQTEGGIELSKKQEALLERWSWCDEKMRENVGKLKREEIANLLINRFKIARCTAFQDIVNTEYVFSTSTPLNKRYRVQLRIEFLEKEIRLASLDNDRLAVAMLEKVLQKYYLDYPDLQPNASLPNIFINVDQRTIQSEVILTEDAEAIIDEAIENMPDGEISLDDLLTEGDGDDEQ